MNKFKINWSDLDENRQNALAEFSGFYALVAENIEDEASTEVDLLYIGMAYERTILNLVKQPYRAFDFLEEYEKLNLDMETFFMVGLLQENAPNETPKNIFSNIQCLLVRQNEPLFNVPCKEIKSNHTANLSITNSGDYEPLEEFSDSL
ncbi:MAG: hypothetical protein ABUK01_06745 [Leptospirales bacterium]